MELNLIENKIYEVRGQKIMLDKDLAAMYGVPTSRLNEAVKRNKKRFPPDFMFQLTKDEYETLISQNAISKTGRGGTRKLPNVFTEQGVSMLSSVLNSERAIEVNIVIMRTFILLRQNAMRYKELQDKLQELEQSSNDKFNEIYNALNLLIEERTIQVKQKNREPIGFKTKSR